MTFAEQAQLGESFVGLGADAAHINTALGRTGGPVELAWITSLATPRMGFAPFVTVLAPNLPVKPYTLFVNKAAIANETHGLLTWGAAQAGVAAGVADAVADHIIPVEEVDNLRIIVAVWVNPEASDEQAVFVNNRTATCRALQAGADLSPDINAILTARAKPQNPFFSGVQ
ncbi:formaldehyde-activating enzyme [Ferrimicrobium sp.]|uniref:formaldehyde-activating enzyme n=1 Tax=Ferrimicrobium sp. TaxID=2926050 RepID=UPI00261B29BC|nr:formaldehyde-activating enzyme [Ferrimicrobium sp.]MCL5973877.1 formaldehyde-activating enzyme [Actinomycetota bacterium]